MSSSTQQCKARSEKFSYCNYKTKISLKYAAVSVTDNCYNSSKEIKRRVKKKFGLGIREEFLRVRLAVPNPNIPEGCTGTSPGAELHLHLNLQQAFIRDKCARLYLFIYATKHTQCSSTVHRQTK